MARNGGLKVNAVATIVVWYDIETSNAYLQTHYACLRDKQVRDPKRRIQMLGRSGIPELWDLLLEEGMKAQDFQVARIQIKVLQGQWNGLRPRIETVADVVAHELGGKVVIQENLVSVAAAQVTSVAF